MEGLSLLIKDAKSKGYLIGVKVKVMFLSYIFFLDDVLL